MNGNGGRGGGAEANHGPTFTVWIEPNYAQRRDAIKVYLQSCVDAGDWHGVRDAACDIEVLEARMQEISKRAAGSGGSR